MVISIQYHPLDFKLFIQGRSSDLCLSLSIIPRGPYSSMPDMPDEGGNGTSTIVSSVYEKKSNLIKITLAGVEKIPDSSPRDASVYITLSVLVPAAAGCWHLPRLLATHPL